VVRPVLPVPCAAPGGRPPDGERSGNLTAKALPDEPGGLEGSRDGPRGFFPRILTPAGGQGEATMKEGFPRVSAPNIKATGCSLSSSPGPALSSASCKDRSGSRRRWLDRRRRTRRPCTSIARGVLGLLGTGTRGVETITLTGRIAQGNVIPPSGSYGGPFPGRPPRLEGAGDEGLSRPAAASPP